LILKNHKRFVFAFRDLVKCRRVNSQVILFNANCLIVCCNPTETQVVIVMSFLNGMNTLVGVNHEVIIKSYGSSLLVRVTLKHVMVNVFLALICGILLLLLLFCISRKTDVLTVGDFILPIIRLEIVEHVLPELKIDVDRYLVRITRIHFTQLIVNIQILVRKQSHVYNSKIGLTSLGFVYLLLSSSLSRYIMVPVNHLDTSSHVDVHCWRWWSGWYRSTT
jgi:hypothetical protein